MGGTARRGKPPIHMGDLHDMFLVGMGSTHLLPDYLQFRLSLRGGDITVDGVYTCLVKEEKGENTVCVLTTLALPQGTLGKL